MFQITITLPKEIDNVYSEVENLLFPTIHHVEANCFDFEKKKYKSENTLQYIKDNKLFENDFDEIILRLKKHLLEQLKNSTQIQITSFFEKQKMFAEEFSPEKRKKYIYEDYLVFNIAFGDESILNGNYKLSEYETSIIKLVYEKYSEWYKKLNILMNELHLSYSPTSSKSYFYNDNTTDTLINTIDEYLEPFKNEFKNEIDYNKAVEYLKQFYEGKKPKIEKVIFVKNGNKTKLALELGKLYRNEKNDTISKEYLQLLISLFSVFNKEKLNKEKLTDNNLYKYCTTKKKI